MLVNNQAIKWDSAIHIDYMHFYIFEFSLIIS